LLRIAGSRKILAKIGIREAEEKCCILVVALGDRESEMCRE
jgi:hypothetical protein